MKTMLKIGFGFVFALSLLGCQPTRGPSEEALILEMLDTFVESNTAQDIDAFMSLVSENYSDPGSPTKQAAREFMTAGWDTGEFDNADVSFDEAKIVITATVYPVKITLPAGNATERLTLSNEDGAWLISSIEILP